MEKNIFFKTLKYFAIFGIKYSKQDICTMVRLNNTQVCYLSLCICYDIHKFMNTMDLVQY